MLWATHTSCEVGPLLCTHFLDEDIQPYLSLEPELLSNAHSHWLLFYWHLGDTEDQVLLPLSARKEHLHRAPDS